MDTTYDMREYVQSIERELSNLDDGRVAIVRKFSEHTNKESNEAITAITDLSRQLLSIEQQMAQLDTVLRYARRLNDSLIEFNNTKKRMAK